MKIIIICYKCTLKYLFRGLRHEGLVYGVFFPLSPQTFVNNQAVEMVNPTWFQETFWGMLQ